MLYVISQQTSYETFKNLYSTNLHAYQCEDKKQADLLLEDDV